MAIYAIVLNATNWTQTTSRLYFNTADYTKIYSDASATQEVSQITIPTRELYRFGGFKATVGGVANTICIDEQGQLKEALYTYINNATSGKSVSVVETHVSSKITVNSNGGTGGPSALYRPYPYTSGADIYSDYLLESPVTQISELPTKQYNAFKGYFNNGTTGTTQYVESNGNILPALRNNNVSTIYAQWAHLVTITYSPNLPADSLGEQVYSYDGPTVFYYALETFFSDDTATQQIGTLQDFTIPMPTLLGFYCSNLNSAPDGSGDRIFKSLFDGRGEFVGSAPTANFTCYAIWLRGDYVILLKSGGTGGSSALLHNGHDVRFRLPGQSTYTKYITLPSCPGFVFGGYLDEDSVEQIASNGYITATQVTASDTIWYGLWSKTLYAQWVHETRTVTFNANGGSTTLPSKEAFVGKAVGNLPAAYRDGYSFVGWYSAATGGTLYTPITIMPDENIVLYAHWSSGTSTRVEFIFSNI